MSESRRGGGWGDRWRVVAFALAMLVALFTIANYIVEWCVYELVPLC